MTPATAVPWRHRGTAASSPGAARRRLILAGFGWALAPAHAAEPFVPPWRGVGNPGLPSAAQQAERAALLAAGEAALAAGDLAEARHSFEQVGRLAHDADAELGLVRVMMQAGQYRAAHPFAAHVAGAHPWHAGGAGLYAWLLHLGGQERAARDILERAMARLPGDALLAATRTLLATPEAVPPAALLKPPARFAPYAAGDDGLPPAARVIGGGIVIDGARVLTTAVPAPDARLWVRDGRGRLAAARLLEGPTAHGIASLALDAPWPDEELPIAPREAFPGSPAFLVGFAPRAGPSWPRLTPGFLGAATAERGVLAASFDHRGHEAGAAVFDGQGRLAGLLSAPAAGSARIALVSRPAATANPAAATMLPLDALYERALSRVLQVIAAS